MKITKYPQACLLVESADTRILIDPGTPVASEYGAETFGQLDAVLVTHSHADHFDADLVTSIVDRGAALITNSEVGGMIEREARVLDDGDETKVKDVKVRALELEHCRMVDGSAGPLNIGFVLDERLLHPGDSTQVRTTVPCLAVPIAGPDISLHDAYAMVSDSGAETVIPVHYDIFPNDPARLARELDQLRVHILEAGQSTDV